eukprot:Selendium_serpulae@DN5967_c0_g1_i2.p1
MSPTNGQFNEENPTRLQSLLNEQRNSEVLHPRMISGQEQACDQASQVPVRDGVASMDSCLSFPLRSTHIDANLSSHDAAATANVTSALLSGFNDALKSCAGGGLSSAMTGGVSSEMIAMPRRPNMLPPFPFPAMSAASVEPASCPSPGVIPDTSELLLKPDPATQTASSSSTTSASSTTSDSTTSISSPLFPPPMMPMNVFNNFNSQQHSYLAPSSVKGIVMSTRPADEQRPQDSLTI